MEIRRDGGTARAKWTGLLSCRHIWTCPVCSLALRAKQCERINAAVTGMGGRWQMLTVTVRHRQGMPLADLYAGLMGSWRRARQGRAIQKLWGGYWKKHPGLAHRTGPKAKLCKGCDSCADWIPGRVTASVRASEVTHHNPEETRAARRNGWHPHCHVLLRTSEWTDDDRALLLARFRAAVVERLGVECLPDDAHALVWSDPFDGTDPKKRGQYLVKLGLEVAGLGKEGRDDNLSHWQVARRAVAGDERCLLLWREFHHATRARRMLELDDRASDAAKEQLAKQAPDPRLDDADVKGPTVVVVKRDDVRALRFLERRMGAIFALVLTAAEEEGRDGVRDWISYARSRPSLAKTSGLPPAALESG